MAFFVPSLSIRALPTRASKAQPVSRFLLPNLRTITTAATKNISFGGRSVGVPTGLFIGGEFVNAKGGNLFETENPATGKPLLSVAEGREEDVDEAVRVARKTFQTWKDSNPVYRARLLNKLADILERNAEDLVAIECADTGKTAKQAGNLDVPGSIGTLRYYAGWADKVLGQTSTNIPSTFAFTRREPVGVCGQIIPWK